MLTEPSIVRVLIVAPDSATCPRLVHALTEQPERAEVRQVEQIPSAGELADAPRPDVVWLVGELGGGKVGGWVQALKAACPEAPILVLTHEAAPAQAEEILRGGAVGCLLEDDPPNQWLEAVRAVQRGEIFVSDAITSGLLQRVLQVQPEPARAGVESLTDRELAVFELLGGGLKSREIAERLGVSCKTIESHQEKIKHRLGLTNAAALTHFACAWVQRQGAAGETELGSLGWRVTGKAQGPEARKGASP